jgi:hypothetical protein
LDAPGRQDNGSQKYIFEERLTNNLETLKKEKRKLDETRGEKQIKLSILRKDKLQEGGTNVPNKPPTHQTYSQNKSSYDYIRVGDLNTNIKKLSDIKRKMKELCLEINNKFITIKGEDSRFYELLKREEEVTKEEKEKLLQEQRDEEEKVAKLKENADKEAQEDLDLIDAREKEEAEAEAEKNEKEAKEEQKLREKDNEEELKEQENQRIKEDKDKQIELLKLKAEKQNTSYRKINDLLKNLINVLQEQYIEDTESDTDTESD